MDSTLQTTVSNTGTDGWIKIATVLVFLCSINNRLMLWESTDPSLLTPPLTGHFLSLDQSPSALIKTNTRCSQSQRVWAERGRPSTFYQTSSSLKNTNCFNAVGVSGKWPWFLTEKQNVFLYTACVNLLHAWVTPTNSEMDGDRKQL